MGKLIQYFIDVKNEMAKVVWPSRATTVKYTVIVIVFSAVIGAILGAADYGLILLVQRIVTR